MGRSAQLHSFQDISSSKSIPEHPRRSCSGEIAAPATALTSRSVCWPMEKDKQPANLSSKQFVIGHHPDSRGILCFPLLPLHRAKTRETMKVAISFAEPSQTNTLDHSQQLCKGKHAQRLCSGIFLSQN